MIQSPILTLFAEYVGTESRTMSSSGILRETARAESGNAPSQVALVKNFNQEAKKRNEN